MYLSFSGQIYSSVTDVYFSIHILLQNHRTAVIFNPTALINGTVLSPFKEDGEELEWYLTGVKCCFEGLDIGGHP